MLQISPQTGPDQIVMIALGVVVLLAGFTLLRLRRHTPAPPVAGDEKDGEGSGEGPGVERRPLGLSEPSQLTIAIALLVVGYHLVMWGVPAAWASAVAVPPHRWYFVAGGAALAIAASLLLDRTGSWREEE